MSLVAGYFSKSGKVRTEGVQRILSDFRIMPSDRSSSYRTQLIEGEYGHVLVKWHRDAGGITIDESRRRFAVVCLGFMQLCGPGRRHGSKAPDLPLQEVMEEIREAEGQFVCVVVEHDTGTVHVVNDRFSSRPFYLYQKGDTVLFSSNLVFLIALARERSPSPDPLGWLQIVSYSHTLGTRTNYENIKRLRPATHLRISRRGIEERKYWRLQHHVRHGLDPESFAEATFEALGKSTVNRCRGKKGLVALSGGLDSRLVAATVPPADFFAFTMSDSVLGEETSEVKAARDVAKRLGLRHRVKQIGEMGLSDMADDIAVLVGGLSPITHHMATMHFAAEISGAGRFIVGGGPGDVLAGSYVPSPSYLEDRKTEAALRQFVRDRKICTKRELGLIFCREVIEQYFPRLDQSLEESFQDIHGPTAAHRVTAWAMVIRQPAFTFSAPIHNHPYVNDLTPHLGYTYSDLMLMLPAEWIFNRNFYQFMIYHSLPSLRDVIYANTNCAISGRLEAYGSKNSAFAEKVMRELLWLIKIKLPYEVISEIRKVRLRRYEKIRDFHGDMLRGDKALSKEVCDILNSYEELHRLFNIHGCMKFIESFQAGRLTSCANWTANELYAGLATACYLYKNLH